MIELQLYKPKQNKILTIKIVILGIAFVIIYCLFPTMDLSVFVVAFFIFIAYLAFTEKKQRVMLKSWGVRAKFFIFDIKKTHEKRHLLYASSNRFVGIF